MKHTLVLRGVVLSTACAAALSLAACNPNGAGQNGAYVAGSNDTSLPVASQVEPPVGSYRVAATTPPPPLPDYNQPPPPAAGYYWTPGYWDWSEGDADYYWVPGTWVEPPERGLYWTPGYWRFWNGRYLFSDGYWGPQVGFYGGVDYGWGYDGSGYGGGRWQGREFYYNDQANNLGGRRFDHVYSQGGVQTAPGGVRRASFNGGPGGVRVAPTQVQVQAAQGRHAGPTSGQIEQARTARAVPQLLAGANRGAPPIAATPRAAAFHGANIVAARSAAGYTPPARPVRGEPGSAGLPAGAQTAPFRPGATGPAGRPGGDVRAEPPGRPAAGPQSERPAARFGGAPSERQAVAPLRSAPPEARHTPVEHAPAAQTDRAPERSYAPRPAPEARAPTAPQRVAPESHAAPPPQVHAQAPAARSEPQPTPRAAPEPRREPEKH